MKLFLAGPLFTAAEIAFNVRLKDLLVKAGFEVWLPQEHKPKEITATSIFLNDVAGIDWCDVVVANMDGPDPDSGTCWECGYAYKKKPIVLFRTDFRVGYELRNNERAAAEAGKAPYNLMLTESADVRLDLPCKSVAEVAEAIEQALVNLPPPQLL